MLKLRRGTVVSCDPLEVEIAGRRRPAWADRSLVGETRVGDEVIVNTEAVDLGLGSGGQDIVHVNLTRGLQGAGHEGGAHVMKLNYTSLQHPVEPAEPPLADGDAAAQLRPERPIPVLVGSLHGQLAPAVWAFHQHVPGKRLGFVQGLGGALGAHRSETVRRLRDEGLLSETLTAGPCHGGDAEAISLAGALRAACDRGWDAAVVCPGPGILGSGTALGHGGMAALDAAHAALALGLPAIFMPRASTSDPRPRHRGLSHHAAAVLDLVLAPLTVAVPADDDELAAESVLDRHRIERRAADLDAYVGSGLPSTTMGRDAAQDPRFFAVALAGGAALAAAAG
ncbi:MAG: DUF3866 family protein [Solirubrobacterales bacterium]